MFIGTGTAIGVLDPAPRVGTIAYESHTVIVERDRLRELITAEPRELQRRLELFADVAAVPMDLVTRLCQARAVSSALHEAIEGTACWQPSWPGWPSH